MKGHSHKYSPSVRIGNWYEDLYSNEGEINKYCIEHNTKAPIKELIKRHYLREVELSRPSPHIHFGDTVQLVASQIKVNDKYENCRPALSIVVTEEMLLHPKPLDKNCDLCIAPSVVPTIRNSFKIISLDRNLNESNAYLKYGDIFLLESLASNKQHFLYCPPNSINLTNVSLSSYKSYLSNPLGLVLCNETKSIFDIPQWHCYWKCIYNEPLLRFEMEGEPLKSDTPLIIRHLATNQNLTAEKYQIETAFGEACLVSAKTYKNVKKIESPENLWNIVIRKAQ